eukprot:TRINITY_DN5288_c0_g1_i1.p1 TRINITY_DN5288_c0_g1~~TRINITY_DN5288_c0_g1_i1.p1  ORF type:complete len:699 (+),score=138.90 TRINITY_DN5288_c0_g1_i1:64-2097(+)
MADVDVNVVQAVQPDAAFREAAHVKSLEEYQKMYKASIEKPSEFWGDVARTFHWETMFTSVGPHYNFDKNKGPIKIEWFPGGRTNVCYNCLDRHVISGKGSKVALQWEGNDLDDAHKQYTYEELLEIVCTLANAMRADGIKKGDRVSIYMPMIMHLPVTMLACARIGAIHSVIFGGFSADTMATRLVDARSRLLVTADGVMRGAKPVQLKVMADEACALASKAGFNVERVVCVGRFRDTSRQNLAKHGWVPGRDVWFSDYVAGQKPYCYCEWVEAEDPLFMLYTSGSTGKPKGVLHTTGGYMVGVAASMKYVFDHKSSDVFFCTADCGWITGHSYIAYGPFLNHSTQVLFEGVPTHPNVDRFWQVCAKYRVSTFYTAPTAIRSLMKSGDAPVKKHDLSSLRLLGSVGEPINREAWLWYFNTVGKGRCPIVDTYWQTETGSHLLTPLGGAIPMKPGCATLPFFGVDMAIVNEKTGEELQGECQGALVMKRPPPSFFRTVFEHHERFVDAYFAQYPGYYFTGDGARRDRDGYYWITGRMDDVINVSGHRIGTAEVETVLMSAPAVAEAAAVGFPHDVKGEGIWAYVTLKNGYHYTDDMKKELKAHVRKLLGAFAAPDEIHWAPGLPKTQTGKIMRRVLRKLALPDFMKQDLGDTSTLADPTVIDVLKENHPRAAPQSRL